MAARHRSAGRVRTRRTTSKKTGITTERYSAMLWIGDKEQTLGTFDTWDAAQSCYMARSTERSAGIKTDLDKLRTPFRDFAVIWEARFIAKRQRSKNNINDTLKNHLLPFFGSRHMEDLMDRDLLQDFRTFLDNDEVRVLSWDSQRTIIGHLSSVLGQATLWGYLPQNPVRGMFKFGDGVRKSRAFKMREIRRLQEVFPGPVSKLFVDLAVQSGLRWGELAELRVDDIKYIIDEDVEEEDEEDLDFDLLYLHVRRNVVEINDLEAGRFKVEPTPKNGEARKVSLGKSIGDRLQEHNKVNGLSGQDLVFPRALFDAELKLADEAAMATVTPIVLGFTEPNEKGRTYRHGTPTAYGMAPCRCEWCQDAMRSYRAQRRKAGLDRKPPTGTRAKNRQGHLPHDTFRNQFWIPALSAAGIGTGRFHDLRHTHATLLSKQKHINPWDLKKRMGHKRMETTMRYITDNQVVETRTAHLMERLWSAPSRDASRRRHAG
jgi:integrase